eukprot:TRINITY_DN2805_c0_g1_i1.p1 TRINITY_DN2805_c0_g1~~TRINITY_DN2805_c0_g1_i1.p1  ORF type:complete len:126 (-),score=42.39 TRINITY_DN2805_c0_g1_i1:139-516(-)
MKAATPSAAAAPPAPPSAAAGSAAAAAAPHPSEAYVVTVYCDYRKECGQRPVGVFGDMSAAVAFARTLADPDADGDPAAGDREYISVGGAIYDAPCCDGLDKKKLKLPQSMWYMRVAVDRCPNML